MRLTSTGWLCLGLGAALACGNSMAPPSPDLAGTWSVGTSRLDVGGALEGNLLPSPFLLKVTANGNTLSDTFPTLTWQLMTGGTAWTFPPGEPNNAIVGSADTLTFRIYSTPDAGSKTCTLVYRGILIGTDSLNGSVLVSGSAVSCAAANGGTWGGKRQ